MIEPSKSLEKVANVANLIGSIMLINMFGQILFFRATFDNIFWGIQGNYYFIIIIFLLFIGSYSKFVFWFNKNKKHKIKTK